MLVIIVIFRFLFDFILFCRYQIKVEKMQKEMKTAINKDLGRLDSYPTRIVRPNLFFDPKEKGKNK